jgi:O-antigen ligase
LRWLAVLSFGLGLPALVFTLSRGAWIAFVVSVSLLYFGAWRRRKLPTTVPVITGTVVLVSLLAFQSAISDRLSSAAARETANVRWFLMDVAVRMIEDNPVLGVGVNNYNLEMWQYMNRVPFQGIWIYSVHNKYLLIWAETGIFGILAFVWFLLATMRRGWRAGITKDRFVSALALGFTAAIGGHIFHMNLDTFRNRAAIQLLWLFAGLVLALSRVDEEPESGTSAKSPAGETADRQILCVAEPQGR